ncbi:bifunctional YncE family protein/alkaline phosphatase family protein [Microbispora sp. NPDC049125]|uniref:bifunctional YncE family protein/alkaline phosphatase family protein n=1 Tax=Microbispora sp. NPDC049125 TaxID=3154929 RepID=UPI0034665B21
MHSRSRRLTGLVVAAVLLAGGGAAYGVAGGDPPGPRGDGTGVTPGGYRITPAGAQVALGPLPLASALSPDGSRMLVTNDGKGKQSLQVVDTATGQVTQTLPYGRPEALYAGVAWSPDGTRAYASAGGNDKIRVFDVSAGRLAETEPFPLPAGKKAFPAGLAVSPGGETIYVAGQLADAFYAVDTATGAVRAVPVGHNPYGVTVSRDGATAYVTNQGAATVSVVDLRALAVTATLRVGTHPNKAVLDRSGRRLYVAASDSDEVHVIGTAGNRVIRRFDLRPGPAAEVGGNPAAVALSPDERVLYVADSGTNDVAVLDAEDGRTLGRIPTGWYPTSVQAVGDRLLVTNAKGLGAGPNAGADPASHRHIDSMLRGTLSVISGVADPGRLAEWSRQVAANTPAAVSRDGGGVVPARPGAPTPIKHVIYVVRENRTYDQVLGDLGKGDGDPRLTLFGDTSAPNTRELARRFVTLDDFYADAEISAQGWSWSTAANSNAYTEQTWPAYYSRRGHPYDYEGGNPATAPGRDRRDAYLWNRLAAAGVSYRNYGFYTTSKGVAAPLDPDLPAHTDPTFAGFDLSKSDHCDEATGIGRMCAWLREFRAYESSGTLPAVELVRLPNDHTAGTKPGVPVPKAYVADNDYALGQLVDAVSHSAFWPSTAIFVVEDDAQNGPDHVDAHRTVALIVSPYTQTGRVDSTFYSTVSMLRTIELIAGIGPMTRFDASATPMTASFTDRPVMTPYDAILPAQPFDERNAPDAPLAAASAKQPPRQEERVDEQVFNRAIWQSVKGRGSRMPAPRHGLAGILPGGR